MAKTAKKDEFIAVENPQPNALCGFWLARVVEAYIGANKEENGVLFVKGGWYLKIYVYKPVKVGAEVAFKFDNNPSYNNIAVWEVDAESVIYTGLAVTPFNQRKSARGPQTTSDMHELKRISDSHFKEIKRSLLGPLVQV